MLHVHYLYSFKTVRPAISYRLFSGGILSGVPRHDMAEVRQPKYI